MKYPVKVWLLTILIAPLVSFIIMFLENGASFSVFDSAFVVIFFMILFGLLLSLPSLFLFWYLSDELNDRALKSRNKKLILCLCGVFLIWITFFLMNKSLFSKWNFYDYNWPLSYSFVMVLLTITLKMKIP